MRPLLSAFVVVVSAAGCGRGALAPSSQPVPATRVISLSGPLAFGAIPVGATAEATLSIQNDGNSPLVISGMTGPPGYTASFTSGTIASGASQPVTIRFAPDAVRSYDGVVTVNGNQTAGVNTVPISGAGMRDLFVKSGTGDAEFDIPADVRRIRIRGEYRGYLSNFIVTINSEIIVNRLLGTYSGNFVSNGEYAIPSGGLATISFSHDVAWTLTEVR